MTPTAECQCAGGGTGLGAGRIYCHDAGDRLHGSACSTACSLQQHLQTQNIYEQRFKCMFQSIFFSFVLPFYCYAELQYRILT